MLDREYEELIQSLREKAEFLTVSDVQKAPPGLSIKNLFAETMSEAADAIEAMREMVADAYSENANLIASYEDRLRWIPVTERLPEDAEDVIAWIEDEHESRMTAANYDSGVWYDCIMHHEEKRVKYWMQKPEPPKEGNDDEL